MQKRAPCEKCGKMVAPYESVSLGSIEEGYQHLCMVCTNAEIAEHAGVDFKHPEYLPMTLTDVEGIEHEFHFNTRLLGDRVAISALEIKNGEPHGYDSRFYPTIPKKTPLNYSAVCLIGCNELYRKGISMSMSMACISQNQISSERGSTAI